MEALALKPNPSYREEIGGRLTSLGDPRAFYACLTCGMCTCGCIFGDEVSAYDPRRFVRQVVLGLKEQAVDETFLWGCTLCNRCTMLCPMNIKVYELVRAVRGTVDAPGFIQTVVNDTLETGNQMRITTEELLDTLEWMAEELSAEVGKEIKIPVDVEGAEILFIPHPREIKYYPQDIQSWTKIFWAAGISWTISTKAFDVTNFGIFNGRDDEAIKIWYNTHNEFKRLGCKRMVMVECGHGYFGYKYLGRFLEQAGEVKFDYPVLHLVEFLAELLRDGKIKVDPAKNPDPVTLHDPCNLVRKSGVIEEPRFVLQKVCQNFVEMWPNREYNYCCGGGGGTLAAGDDIRKVRLAVGKKKIEQIDRTGAKIVCAPCHNCADQLNDLFKEYKRDYKHVHLHHLVSEALVLE